MKTENYYNGKTNLLVTYQYNVLDPKRGDERILIDQNYDTLDEAYAAMENIMPDAYEANDGDEIDDWNAIIEKGGREPWDEIFMQYVYYADDNHGFLAELRPVLNSTEDETTEGGDHE